MANRKGRFRIGTSGYQYNHWKGILYDEDLPKKDWFARYASEFETVEINNTFYRLPEEDTFRQWRVDAPEGFCYALKYSRYGSHMKRLKDPQGHVNHFLDRARLLGGSLGPILVQLPPNFKLNRERLADFLDARPADYRWTFEFRDPSWLCDEVFDLLREHRAGLCVHDQLEDHPRPDLAEWVYLRFHGPDGGGYTPQQLTAAAKRIRDDLDAGRDVYAYFNNDAHGHAIYNARDLRRFVTEND